MTSSRLPLIQFSGSASACGEIYGAEYAALLRGFLAQELSPSARMLNYARRCVPYVKRHAPRSYEFMRGMARTSGLAFDRIVLLSLHEEIYHLRRDPSHCTAIVAVPNSTQRHRTIVAQNWDWQPQLYPWPGLVRIAMRGAPRVLAYHYPGLWNCCGINSEGLALMWTGGGYFPPLKPTVGVPTYVLISELLRLSSIHEARRFLETTPRAGAFMLLLGDAGGNGLIVEATSKAICLERCETIAYRANLFRSAKMIRKSKQHRPTKKILSVGRIAALQDRFGSSEKKLTRGDIQAALADPRVQVNRGIKSMTIDQCVAVCEERAMWVRRGGDAQQHWIRYRV